MHYRSLITKALCFLSFSSFAHAYFHVSSPTKDMQWVNGKTYMTTWSKGVNDGVVMFDLELARLSVEGLILVAQNIDAKLGSLSITLNDIPPGDDYYLLYVNSIHGVMHATSPKFAILASGSDSTSNGTTPTGTSPTVTVSGAPNPTAHFATTFPVISAALPILRAPHFAPLLAAGATLIVSALTLLGA
ncbi:hypothetical protein PENSPDRAFT_755880 [Peniophora sp. CONT]|nr:hypothetical protein PENSPDRAFT_755880 [Peniophora sp. CONT]